MAALPDRQRSGESEVGRKKMKPRPRLTPGLGPHRGSGCMKAARSMTAPRREPGRDGVFFFFEAQAFDLWAESSSPHVFRAGVE